jgi:hypothetical protein
MPEIRHMKQQQNKREPRSSREQCARKSGSQLQFARVVDVGEGVLGEYDGLGVDPDGNDGYGEDQHNALRA